MGQKMQTLIRSFLNEGLIGKDGTPVEMAKLNPQMQQNLSTTPPPADPTDVPAPAADAVTNAAKDEPQDEVKDNLKKAEEALDEGDSLDEIQAAHSGILIAEYHVGKLCSSLTEGEDIDLEKLRGTKTMLTDARKSMYEYWSKKRKGEKKEPVEESSDQGYPERVPVTLPKGTSFTAYQVKPDGTLANKEHLNDAREVADWYGRKNYGHICLINDTTGEKMFYQDTEGGLIRESRDLIGASVFGIGGEEKLVDLSKGRQTNEYQIPANSNDIDLIKSTRKGDAGAPFFIQVGGNYFVATAKKGIQSDIVLINHQPERLNKKQALEMLKGYQANKKDTVATQTI
jgi:hypothetical protein